MRGDFFIRLLKTKTGRRSSQRPVLLNVKVLGRLRHNPRPCRRDQKG